MDQWWSLSVQGSLAGWKHRVTSGWTEKIHVLELWGRHKPPSLKLLHKWCWEFDDKDSVDVVLHFYNVYSFTTISSFFVNHKQSMFGIHIPEAQKYLQKDLISYIYYLMFSEVSIWHVFPCLCHRLTAYIKQGTKKSPLGYVLLISSPPFFLKW